MTALTVFVVKLASCISCLQPAPLPPAEGGARDLLIESDGPAGSDINWELRPLSWEGDFSNEERAWSCSLQALQEIISDLIKQWNAAIKSHVTVLIVGLSCVIRNGWFPKEISYGMVIFISCALTSQSLQSCQRCQACEGSNLPIIWKPF